MRYYFAPMEGLTERVDGGFGIGSGGAQGHGSTGHDTQRHDTQQAFGVHPAAAGFQPDAAFKFVGLLYEVGRLSVMQAGFTTNHHFFIEHFHTLLFTIPTRIQRV